MQPNRSISSLIWLFALVTIICSSCSRGNKKEDEMYRSMKVALERSNEAIHENSFTHYASLDSKLYDPKTREKTIVWEPKAQAIKLNADQIIKTIKLLKWEIDDKNKNEEEILSDRNLEDLFVQLQNYKSNVLSIDSMIREEFLKKINIDPDVFGVEKSKNDFVESFKGISPVGTSVILTRLENSVYYIENNLVTYIDYNISSIIDVFDVYGILIGQSTNIIESSKEIEITAGVGAYSSAANPSISINHEAVTIKDGQGKLKIKAPDKPGDYSVPVVVRFTDEDGKERIMKEEVKYKVSDLH